MMTYAIRGLPRTDFVALFALDDASLAARGARRVVADRKPGFPCRISLQDAEPGEALILLHHVSHRVGTPYRSAYAILVREDAAQAARYFDAVPPVLDGRAIALRAFDADAMLRDVRLAMPGGVDAGIRALFANPEIAYIHAHNAAHGCFAARIDRA
ncbi:DUF1203 domain-containing protein [Blastomonas sp.]|uniref:DUF1203 domain-containing protein n=1 Tax=Blastomonas sp. TaxID=1909299 RepID=UPI00359397F5